MKTLKILITVIIGAIMLSIAKAGLAVETEADLVNYIPYYKRALARSRTSYVFQLCIPNMIYIVQKTGKSKSEAEEIVRALIKEKSDKEVRELYQKMRKTRNVDEIKNLIYAEMLNQLSPAERKYIEEAGEIDEGNYEEFLTDYLAEHYELPCFDFEGMNFEDIIGIASRLESSPGSPEITIVAADIQDRDDFIASLPATAAYNKLHYSGIQNINIDIADIIADSNISEVLSDKQKAEGDLQDKQSLMEEMERDIQDLKEVIAYLKTAEDKIDALQREYDNTNWWNPLNWPRYFSLKDKLEQAKAEYDALCNEYGKTYEQAKAEYEQAKSNYADLEIEYEQAKAEYEAKYDIATGEADTVAKLISAMSIGEAVKEFSSLSTSRIAQLLANPYLSSDQAADILLKLYSQSPDKVEEILLGEARTDGLLADYSSQKAYVIRDKLLEKTITSGELDLLFRVKLFSLNDELTRGSYGYGIDDVGDCTEFARNFAIKASLYNIPAKLGLEFSEAASSGGYSWHVLNCVKIVGEWYVVDATGVPKGRTRVHTTIMKAEDYQRIRNARIHIYESDSRMQTARDALGHPELGIGGGKGEPKYEGLIEFLPRP
ncbi:MAG: hypothetical protein B5M48_01285 [Candidatus Omnitrophica bacterium 4484_213]|nr:MAG: hypothetical protein B5M48_01285 [Candidatus Omnitrophica bacterium 4484_213]